MDYRDDVDKPTGAFSSIFNCLKIVQCFIYTDGHIKHKIMF